MNNQVDYSALADNQHMLGKIKANDERYSDAIADFALEINYRVELEKHHPHINDLAFAEARYYHGFMCGAIGQHEEANQSFQNAFHLYRHLDEKNDLVFFHYFICALRIGKHLIQRGEYDEAIHYMLDFELDLILSKNSEKLDVFGDLYARLCFLISRARTFSGNLELAEKHIKKAIAVCEQLEENPSAQLAQCRLHYGRILSEKAQFEEADTQYQAAQFLFSRLAEIKPESEWFLARVEDIKNLRLPLQKYLTVIKTLEKLAEELAEECDEAEDIDFDE